MVVTGPGERELVLGDPQRIPNEPWTTYLVVGTLVAIVVAAVVGHRQPVVAIPIALVFGGLAAVIVGFGVRAWLRDVRRLVLSMDSIVAYGRRGRPIWRLPLAGLTEITVRSQNHRVSISLRSPGTHTMITVALLVTAPAEYDRRNPDVARYRVTRSQDQVTYLFDLGYRPGEVQLVSTAIRAVTPAWRPALGPIADRGSSPRRW